MKSTNRTVCAAAILAVSAWAAQAGWEYTSVTTGDDTNSPVMVVKGCSDGDRARVEFTGGTGMGPMMEPGSYLVTKDGGKIVHLVNPKERRYSVWDMQAMMGMAGGMMQMTGMKISNPKVEKLLEENGGTVAGYPTTHYRFRTSYGMEMNMFGMMQNSSTIVRDEDVWATTKIADMGMGVWLKKQPIKTGSDDLDALIKAQAGKMQGIPLRMVSVNTTRDSSGRERVSRSVMEVKSLRSASPAATLFEIPAGFQETPLMGGEAGGDEDATGGSAPARTGKPGRAAPQGGPGAGMTPEQIMKMMQERMKQAK